MAPRHTGRSQQGDPRRWPYARGRGRHPTNNGTLEQCRPEGLRVHASRTNAARLVPEEVAVKKHLRREARPARIRKF